MDKSIRKNREICVQLLYAMNENKIIIDNSLIIFMSLFQVTKKNMLEYIKSAEQIFSKRKNFDDYLQTISKEYSLDRIAKIDLAILRVILYELTTKKLPIEIAVTEAIRLAKKFSSYGAEKYLHAMIDSIYKEMMHEKKSTV